MTAAATSARTTTAPPAAPPTIAAPPPPVAAASATTLAGEADEDGEAATVGVIDDEGVGFAEVDAAGELVPLMVCVGVKLAVTDCVGVIVASAVTDADTPSVVEAVDSAVTDGVLEDVTVPVLVNDGVVDGVGVADGGMQAVTMTLPAAPGDFTPPPPIKFAAEAVTP